MGALRLPPYPSSLTGGHRRLDSTSRALNETQKTTNLKTHKPFFVATLSKSKAEVSPVQSLPDSVTTRDNDALNGTSFLPPPLKVSADSLQYPEGYLGAIPDCTVPDGNDDIVNAMDYLTQILASKVYDVAIESPLQLALKLSERLGIKVWLKREDLQPVSTFVLCLVFVFLRKDSICFFTTIT